MIKISKNFALALVCHLHQAEKSLAHALSSPTQWPEYLAFYDTEKKANLSRLSKTLSCYQNGNAMIPARDELVKYSFWTTLILAANFLRNRWRRRWTLHSHEVAFFRETLKQVLQMAQTTDRPDADTLRELRLDCYYSCYALERKLFGVQELRQAMSIDYFNRPDSVPSISYSNTGFSKV